MGTRRVLGNALIITLGSDCRVIPNGGVAIEDGLISAVGPCDEIRSTRLDWEYHDNGGRVLMPGMTCIHTHLYSTFARGMALKTEAPRSFGDILERLWWRLDKALNADDVWYSAAVALIGCIRAGTTTIMDHHSSPSCIPDSLDIVADAVTRTGIRACLAYEVSDRDGAVCRDQGIEENKRFIERCKRERSPLLKACFGLHASFTLEDATLTRCALTSQGQEAGFHLHVAEGREDLEHSMARHGMGVVHRLKNHGILGAKAIAAHCVHVDADEIRILSETGAGVAHNPESNMGNAVGAAPVADMIRAGVTVGLGTDGYTMDMFESIKSANCLIKHANANPSAGWTEVPDMAFGGNREVLARYWDHPLGSIEPGAYADLIVLDYHAPTPLTSDNWYGHLLFGMSAGLVRSTIVGGEFLMKDRALLVLDEEEVCRKSAHLASAVWERI